MKMMTEKKELKENPYKPKSAKEIYSDLKKSRVAYEQGNYEDFDEAIKEISNKYNL